jgi:hypothetical protein
VTATMVKKRLRAARATVTRVVGDEEGDGDGDKRTVAATDSEWRAVSGNGRRTAAATEKERAGAAAEPSFVFCLNLLLKVVFLMTYVMVKYDT